jgi:nucleotide-binding universal stress UspA family protein
MAPWRGHTPHATLRLPNPKEELMRGAIVCAVTDDATSGEALALGVELSERLGLRLVLAHPVEGIASLGDGESMTTKMGRQGAEQRLARLAAEHGVAARAERRVLVGHAAALLGQIAAEEAAELIVVPARARGWRGHLDARLATELETETPVPVVVAPPRRAAGRATLAAAQG